MEIVGMGPEAECEHAMFVQTPRDRRTLAIPLAQIDALAADDATRQAVADWHDGGGQGHQR